MIVQLKTFSNLNVFEWHNIITLRAQVFVVEQHCVYQDPDQLDECALHLWFEQDGECISYLRMLPPQAQHPFWKIGRVVVKSSRRSEGLGKALLKTALSHIGITETIHISAQLYLKRFYENLGFIPEGEMYLEDGIPHLFMTRVAVHQN